jgi:hypothetical protein
MIAHPTETLFEMTDEEARALFEKRAQRFLHLSAAEFLERYDRGDYEGVDDPEVAHLVMLLPLVR